MRAKIKRAVFYGTWLIRFSCCTIFFLIVSLPLRFNKKYQDLWLISERPDEARDNGYWLYKWILDNEPDTNVRFVLSKDSVDYEKMPRKDLIIEPNSAKHYIYYILSSYSVSTHMHGACPGKSFCIPFLPFMRHKTNVFLQHGITKNNIKLRGGLDGITLASDMELKPLLAQNPQYKNKAYVVGFCRYDHLKDISGDEKRKIVLVMPTFRKWLRDIARLKDAGRVFRETEYYKRWNSFLNNAELAEILKKNDLELLFFPHKEMQSLAKNFKTNNKKIKIGKPGEYDIQELLKKSSLLVTDYSSVFYDFVYMNKPVLFYQFDQDDFFSKQYIGNDAEYPFGDIEKNEKDLVEKVASIVDGGFVMQKKYKKDAKEFFKYRDEKNCERVYKLIRSLK